MKQPFGKMEIYNLLDLMAIMRSSYQSIKQVTKNQIFSKLSKSIL
jgi:hypothetical protein